MVEELRQALAAFSAEHNASWLRQRYGTKHPIRSGLSKKPLSPKPPRRLRWQQNKRSALSCQTLFLYSTLYQQVDYSRFLS